MFDEFDGFDEHPDFIRIVEII
jgi:hypothetical protein